MIERNEYLNKLISRKWNGMVKVITESGDVVNLIFFSKYSKSDVQHQKVANKYSKKPRTALFIKQNPCKTQLFLWKM